MKAFALGFLGAVIGSIITLYVITQISSAF
jgi:hypothetical protein